MTRIRTLVLAALAATVIPAAAEAQATQTVTVNVSKTETMGLSLGAVPPSWSGAGVDISAGGTVALGSLTINPSWDLKNNRMVTIDAYFTQELVGDVEDGSPTISISAFSGTKQIGSGATSNVSWPSVGAAGAVVLLNGQTGPLAGDLPRQLDASATSHDVTFGLSLIVPTDAYPSTYTTTLTIRAYTS